MRRVGTGERATADAHGPFDRAEDYREWLAHASHGDDPLLHAIVDTERGRAAGVASYLRIDPTNGSIEVGHLAYSPSLQRTRAATEAIYLMMERAFGLGYRRYEWKCNALNEPSCAAAVRLGFSFERIFRHSTVVKKPKPRHCVVLRDGPRVAAAAHRLHRVARPGELRRPARQRKRLGDLTAGAGAPIDGPRGVGRRCTDPSR